MEIIPLNLNKTLKWLKKSGLYNNADMSQHFIWDFWGERMLRQDNDSVCLRCHETLVVLVTSHFTDGVVLVGNSISLMACCAFQFDIMRIRYGNGNATCTYA